MIETLEAILLEAWPSFDPAGTTPRSLQFTRLGSLKSRRREGALTFLVHADWQTEPCLTVKAVKDAEYEGLVEAGVATSRGHPGLGSLVPRRPTAVALLPGARRLVASA